MIYDVTQMGKIRAARGKSDVVSLCREVDLPYETYEGDMVAIGLDTDEPVLVQRTDWLVVNTTTHTVDVLDDELFKDEFWVMN